MPQPLRLFLLALPLYIAVGVGAYYASYRYYAPRGEQNTRKLVVVVVFDQMRADYLNCWNRYYGEDGFSLLKNRGVWYTNTHIPYANTATGPGHASIGTGVLPMDHGICENRWYDRKRARELNCATADRKYDRVPPMPEGIKPELAGDGLSPERLLVPGIGDHLQEKLGEKARVFSFAIKDRAAVLMGGKKPTACYCFDTVAGEFHTSSYYRETAHPWVVKFNQEDKVPDRWFGKKWERLLPNESDYNNAVGPDDQDGEHEGSGGKGRVFPHPLSEGQDQPQRKYYEALEASPFGNDLLWEFAKTAIQEERIGQSEKTDLLFLGFSSNDIIGHRYGPDSHEMMDATIRADRLVAEMLKFLDDKIGQGNYTFILTADHGVCRIPEISKEKDQKHAARFNPKDDVNELNLALARAFGGGKEPQRWVEKYEFPDMFLNKKLIEAMGKDEKEIAEFVANWCMNRNYILKAYPRHVILSNALPNDDMDPFLPMVRRSYHKDRSGDLFLINEPYCLPIGVGSRGSSHGSPHPYDTHVPLIIYGAGVPVSSVQDDKVSSLILGPILCKMLGVPPPERLAEKLPAAFK